jgi:hypothetical protein
MNRILRGAVVFAASALFLGCGTEPEAFEGGTPDHIVANPGHVYVEAGDSTEVLVRLVDEQGTSLNEPIVFSAVGSGIGLTIDSLFRPVFGPDGTLIANPNNTELRVFVRGDALTSSSFTVTSADKTVTVPVTVLPPTLDATISNITPDIDEPVTITAPAGFTFSSTSEVAFLTGGEPEIVEVAADGSTITFIPKPKSSGTITVTDVTPDYAPTVTIPFDLTESLTLSTESPYSSDDPALAPTIATPGVGESIEFNDIAHSTDQFIKFVVTEPSTFNIIVDWVGGADIDIFICNADGESCSSFGGASSNQPEAIAPELAAGTYTLLIELYSGTLPDYYSVFFGRTL